MVHGNGPNFATLMRLSWPFQRGSTVPLFLMDMITYPSPNPDVSLANLLVKGTLGVDIIMKITVIQPSLFTQSQLLVSSCCTIKTTDLYFS